MRSAISLRPSFVIVLLTGLTAVLWVPRVTGAVNCYEERGVFVCDARPAPPRFSEPPYAADSIYYYRSYAWMEDYAYFYDAPNGKVVEQASEGILYYTIEEQTTDANGTTWYRVGEIMWARHGDMNPYLDSRFPGAAVHSGPERPFGWILMPVRPSVAPDVAPVEETRRLERYTFVEVFDAAEGKAGRVWYDIGKGRWIEQRFLALIDPDPRPKGVAPGDFWVEVDLYQQTVAAYENNRLVYATLASTGLPGFETNEGLFTVYARHEEWDMWGGDVGKDYYYLQDVPHTMFFDDDIALHGAYWHDNFGEVRSHGCVNMPPRGAEWVYYWSEHAPGDTLWVWVHTSSEQDILSQFAGES